MNSPSPDPTSTRQRCQYRTPAGRRCALHILEPASSFCPRHASAQIPDSQDFSSLILKHSGDFDDPAEIKHALASLFKLLASGRITSRRAKALAYIASLLLRTLRDSNGSAASQIEITVEPRHRFGLPKDDHLQSPPFGKPLSGKPIPGEPAPTGRAPQSPAAPPAISPPCQTSQPAVPAPAPQATTSQPPHSPGIVSPSVCYGYPPIRPYHYAPQRSCPLPARRPTRNFRAALHPTPLSSGGLSGFPQ